MVQDLILGTAGHIDHGKTALVRALTGVDTDRLPEEKRRGITIELGFAELLVDEYRLGIVDVPGHERFVRNMLAGATSIDLALLVVAANDSVKPQTREHLEILRLLRLEAGVIALTKCDLVDPAWLELVEDEVRELVAGTFLAEAAIVHTSATTGAGLDELREQLARAARRAANRPGRRESTGQFRLAIDRSFTIPGHGTVVTGSVSRGRARLGDELMIEPGGIPVRVRGLQNHDRPVEHIERGQRAAINLAGVHHHEIGRGQELCSPGLLVPSRLLTVELSLLANSPRPLKDRSRVRVHLGTAELLASVRLLEEHPLVPGSAGLAQLDLSESAVSVWGQPFVLRSESPVRTIGGGVVLDPHAERIRPRQREALSMVRQLNSRDVIERASAAVYCAGLRDWQPTSLARTVGIDSPEELRQTLLANGELVEISISPQHVFHMHRLILEQLCERVADALVKLHAKFPLRLALERSLLDKSFRYLPAERILDAALSKLESMGRLHRLERGVALIGHGPKLSRNEQLLLSQLVDRLRQAGIEAPAVKELQQHVTRNQESVPQLLALAAANQELVEINSNFYLHVDVERAARQRLSQQLADGNGLTMSEIRDVLQTTRKYALPYCEYLDRIGFTRRQGDLRFLAHVSSAS